MVSINAYACRSSSQVLRLPQCQHCGLTLILSCPEMKQQILFRLSVFGATQMAQRKRRIGENNRLRLGLGRGIGLGLGLELGLGLGIGLRSGFNCFRRCAVCFAPFALRRIQKAFYFWCALRS